jgi:hypothetical protein
MKKILKREREKRNEHSLKAYKKRLIYPQRMGKTCCIRDCGQNRLEDGDLTLEIS